MKETDRRNVTLAITGQNYELTQGENALQTIRLLIYKKGTLEKSILYDVERDFTPFVSPNKITYKLNKELKVIPDTEVRTFYAICNEQNLQLPAEGTPLEDMKKMKWSQQELPGVDHTGDFTGRMPFTGGDADTIRRIIYSSENPGMINIPVARAVGRIDSLRFNKEDDSYQAELLSVKLYNCYEKTTLMEKSTLPTITDGERILPAEEIKLETQTDISARKQAGTMPYYLYENYTYSQPSGEWKNSGLPYLEIKWKINGREQTPKIIPIQGKAKYPDGTQKMIYGIKRNHVYRAELTVKDNEIEVTLVAMLTAWKDATIDDDLKK